MSVDPIVAAALGAKAAAPSPARVDTPPPTRSFATTLDSALTVREPQVSARPDACCSTAEQPPAAAPAAAPGTYVALSFPLSIETADQAD